MSNENTLVVRIRMTIQKAIRCMVSEHVSYNTYRDILYELLRIKYDISSDTVLLNAAINENSDIKVSLLLTFGARLTDTTVLLNAPELSDTVALLLLEHVLQMSVIPEHIPVSSFDILSCDKRNYPLLIDLYTRTGRLPERCPPLKIQLACARHGLLYKETHGLIDLLTVVTDKNAALQRRVKGMSAQLKNYKKQRRF